MRPFTDFSSQAARVTFTVTGQTVTEPEAFTTGGNVYTLWVPRPSAKQVLEEWRRGLMRMCPELASLTPCQVEDALSHASHGGDVP